MAQLVEASSSGGLPENPPISMVEAAIDELYDIRDTFFPKDPTEKTARLQKHADAALVLVDSAIPQELRKSTSQRALYEFLRGKILDVFPDYQKEAEDHLSKAVKLNPSLADAWFCLGNCIWKKGDLPSSKNCFTLALSKGTNKKILCQLSMLERSMAQAIENQAHLVDESIQHAKAAVMLDIKDGNSWYNLGNACLTSFFVTGAWDHTKLQQSLKAYQNAEKDELMKLNPDLYFNCATANKYLENYERALHGFEAAAFKDPGLNADKEVNKIIVLLDKLENSLKGGREQKWVQRTEPYRGARPQVNSPSLRIKGEASEEKGKSVPTRVFALSSPEAKESSEVVTSMITISDLPVRVLFDSGAFTLLYMITLQLIKLHLEAVVFTP